MELLLQGVGARVGTGAGTSFPAGPGKNPAAAHPCPSALLAPGPHFLLRLLIIHPRPTPGTPQDANLLPGRSPSSAREAPHRMGAALIYSSPAAFAQGHPHPHPLPPSSLVSSPTDPGPATASAHPQGCSHGAGDSKGELGCNLQGSRNATFPGWPYPGSWRQE